MHPTKTIEAILPEIKAQFPAFQDPRNQGNISFDAPAGTQVPRQVWTRMRDFFHGANANGGGTFAASQRSDDIVWRVREKIATLLNAESPDSIIFGANMTSLNFALSRTLAQNWQPGDEVVITTIDHNANIDPWCLAASEKQCHVRTIPLNAHQSDLAYDQLDTIINETSRTRVVAVSMASNLLGSTVAVEKIIHHAHQHGALVVLDAVHMLPHRLVDVKSLDCDFLLASPYKFFGPHAGIMYGRPEVMRDLKPYKVLPASDTLPYAFESGSLNREAIAGIEGIFDYFNHLADTLGCPPSLDLRQKLSFTYQAVANHESQLTGAMLNGLKEIAGLKIWGHQEPNPHRLPTFSFNFPSCRAGTAPDCYELDQRLSSRNVAGWAGDCYAYNLLKALGPEAATGLVRWGCVHYHGMDDVKQALAALRKVI